MRRHVLVMTALLAAMGLMTVVARTADAESPRGARRAPRARLRAAMLRHLADKLDLTEDEKAEVVEVLQEHRKAVEACRKEHAEEFKELREAMRDARKEGDREKLAELREEMKELAAGRMELAKDLHEKILAALPADKAEHAKELFADARRRRGEAHKRFMRRHPGLRMLATLHRLDLSDEQKEQIRDIIAEAHEKIKDVLSEEQLDKLEKMRERARPRGVGPRPGRDEDDD
ncbi:MAG: hypothetical protein ACOC8F_08225 [Planctomycetota bacterium]